MIRSIFILLVFTSESLRSAPKTPIDVSAPHPVLEIVAYGDMQISLDGQQLFVADREELRIIDLGTKKIICSSKFPGWTKPRYHAKKFTPDGKHCVAIFDRGIDIYDTATGARHPRLTGPKDLAGHVELSPDGRILATSRPGGIVLWDLPKRQSIRELKTEEMLGAFVFSPDGSRLIGVDEKGRVICWNTRSWAVSWANPPHSNRFEGRTQFGILEIDPLGVFVFVNYQDRNGIEILVLANGERWSSYPTIKTQWVGPMSVSPDSRWIIFNSGTDVVTIHETSFPHRRRDMVIPPVNGRIGVLNQFTPDGNLVLSNDGSVISFWKFPQFPRDPVPLFGQDSWSGLLSTDPQKVLSAADSFLDNPTEAVRFVERQLSPLPIGPPESVRDLIAQLDRPQFRARDEAVRRIREMGDVVRADIVLALERECSAEVMKQLKSILWELDDGLSSMERIRLMRIVTLLNLTTTPESRSLLRKLTVYHSQPSVAAKASLLSPQSK